MTTTCPGCGAPKADLCRYCGRGEVGMWLVMSNAEYTHLAACHEAAMRMQRRYQRDTKQPVGFWRSFLGLAGGLLP